MHLRKFTQQGNQMNHNMIAIFNRRSQEGPNKKSVRAYFIFCEETLMILKQANYKKVHTKVRNYSQDPLFLWN
jgi:hypothetical protein